MFRKAQALELAGARGNATAAAGEPDDGLYYFLMILPLSDVRRVGGFRDFYLTVDFHSIIVTQVITVILLTKIQFKQKVKLSRLFCRA